MTIAVNNSRPGEPVVTLFGKLDDGSYDARVMSETSVPYSPYWENGIAQVMVYIEPDDEQLHSMLAALNDGRLDFSTLQSYGSSNGGTSAIPI